MSWPPLKPLVCRGSGASWDPVLTQGHLPHCLLTGHAAFKSASSSTEGTTYVLAEALGTLPASCKWTRTQPALVLWVNTSVWTLLIGQRNDVTKQVMTPVIPAQLGCCPLSCLLPFACMCAHRQAYMYVNVHKSICAKFMHVCIHESICT